MTIGDFPPPKGMRWTDAHGWVPDLPEGWGTVGGKPFNDEMLALRVEIERLRAALKEIADYGGEDKPGRSTITLNASSALQMRIIARNAYQQSTGG